MPYLFSVGILHNIPNCENINNENDETQLEDCPHISSGSAHSRTGTKEKTHLVMFTIYSSHIYKRKKVKPI